ncbi:MAG: FAD-dependent oxidoreductase, partial [bacterium]|nr:FAD-dependent oxidoreductase [bacterium]
MSGHFQIAILGTGPGGYVAALKAAQMGASTAVVEYHPFFGGTCLNWGCIPSKALLASAELIHHVQHAAELGIEVPGPATVNWPKIQQRKDKVLQTLRGGIKGLFGARKVTAFHGKAILDGPGKVAVLRDGAKAEEFTADNIILAVGSLPSRIPGWPTDSAIMATSDEALHWKDLPRRLLIVGGGVIGVEFACMMRAFGVEVTVVEMMTRLLPEMDQHLGETLLDIFKKRGIACHVATKVEDLKIDGGTARVTLGGGQTVETDRVLVATGRRPNTAEIGLETVGLTTDRGFIRVNDRMETPVKNYYCIGDANGLFR